MVASQLLFGQRDGLTEGGGGGRGVRPRIAAQINKTAVARLKRSHVINVTSDRRTDREFKLSPLTLRSRWKKGTEMQTSRLEKSFKCQEFHCQTATRSRLMI